MSKVILRSTEVDSWSKVKRYKNCYHWEGTYLTRSGRLYVGLTKEERDRLSKQTGLDLNDRNFWENFAIRIPAQDLTLNLDDPMDEIKYLFLKSHKHVRNGYGDRTKPKASYILINVEEEAKDTNVNFKHKREAFKHMDKMSLEDMRKCLRIFGIPSVNTNNEVVEQKINEIIDNNPKEFMDKWVNNKTRNDEFLVKESISKNVIRKDKNLYYYGSEVIGRSLEDTISFLKDKENSDIKMAILNQIEYK